MSALGRLNRSTLHRPYLRAANHRPQILRVRLSWAMLVAVAAVWSSLVAPPAAAASSTTASTYVAVVEYGDGDLAVRQFRVSSAQQMAHRLGDLGRDRTVVSVDVDRPVRASPQHAASTTATPAMAPAGLSPLIG